MSELEIIYKSDTGEILTTKKKGVNDTILPEGYVKKCIPYTLGISKDIGEKLFDGENFIPNLEYVKPMSNQEKIEGANNIEDLKVVLLDIL